MRSHWADVVVFAAAFTLFGLVAFAILWSADAAYAFFADLNGVRSVTFVRVGPQPMEALLRHHHAWAAYVTGRALEPAVAPGVFDANETMHMADVRNVFLGAISIAVVALGVVVFRVVRAARRGEALRLLRDGGLAAAVAVTAVGVGALVSFDAVFLAFHQVFFPQGNFLFDPATSNLIRLYPEWYWQGITAAIGVSFIAVALLVSVGSHFARGRGSTTYTRAA